MAGEGYRIWVPGEVITADNVQGYLMDQTVQVFPDAATRGSALTGYVSEGMITYLEDSNSVFAYTGSDWEEVGADPAIFTQGTSGQFLKSLGTAGVEWDSVPTPGAATPTSAGIVIGTTGTAVNKPVALGLNALANASDTASGVFNNVGIGPSAGDSITSGKWNMAIGGDALGAVTTGDGNIGIGISALRFVTTGNNTVAVGFGAGDAYDGSTSNNTFIGALAGAPTTGGYSGSNVMALGYNAAPSSSGVSNQITLGDANITSLRCNVTSISSLSDQRDKKDIEALPAGLDFVNQLNPVRFTWNTRIPEARTLPDGSVQEYTENDVRRGIPDMGFIAQDLVAAEDSIEGHDWLQLTLRDNPDKLEATQGRLIPILVKAIQELSAEVESLKAQVAP